MSLEELLETTFPSASDAMWALAAFLEDVDNTSWKTGKTRKDFLNLKVMGSRIFA